MRVTVDRERCIGSGQCVLAAPDVFDQDDDGLVVLRTSQAEPAEHAQVRAAAKLCPAQVINTFDEQ